MAESLKLNVSIIFPNWCVGFLSDIHSLVWKWLKNVSSPVFVRKLLLVIWKSQVIHVKMQNLAYEYHILNYLVQLYVPFQVILELCKLSLIKYVAESLKLDVSIIFPNWCVGFLSDIHFLVWKWLKTCPSQSLWETL